MLCVNKIMPVRKTRQVRRRQSGAGFFQDLGKGLMKAVKWLRSSKAISKVSGALSDAGVPYAGKVKGVAGSLGFGRRKAIRGRGIANAGGARKRPVGRPRKKTGGSLKLAGAGRKKKTVRRKRVFP